MFCHNDLLLLNILLKDDGGIKLIDHEYAGYNHYMTDIYNLLIEQTFIYDDILRNGFEQDYSSMNNTNSILELIFFY